MVDSPGRPPELPEPPEPDASSEGTWPPNLDEPPREPEIDATRPVEVLSQRDAPPKVESAQPAAPAASPASTEIVRRGPNVVGALVLIGLGIAFLLMNVRPSGAWLFLGLGAAFTVARALTGRYGYAVPAGVLLGFGVFVALQDQRYLGVASGGWFFVLLGLGFVAVYLIGARWHRYWPVFPAAGLAGFGAFVMAAEGGRPLGQLGWLVPYWPVALIALGAWLLVRHYLPRALWTPVDILVVIVFIALASLLIIAYLAPAGVRTGPVGTGQSAPLPVAAAPHSPQVSLTTPARPGQTLSIENASSDTRIRAE